MKKLGMMQVIVFNANIVLSSSKKYLRFGGIILSKRTFITKMIRQKNVTE